MALLEVLSSDRVVVAGQEGGLVASKAQALARLAHLLAAGQAIATVAEIEQVLLERERLQSTGVGGGVAVPHGCVERLPKQVAALLLCPDGVPFDAIDGAPVGIVFGLIGPKGAPAQHLKILARASRLFRDPAFCDLLLRASSGSAAHALIVGAVGGAS